MSCFNIKCPKCGQTDSVRVDCNVTAWVTPDGSADTTDSDVTWDKDNFAYCPECDHSGKAWEFGI